MISINAGMDMAMVPSGYREFFNNLKELVEEGKVPMSRIDDAVTRILRVKFALGLMDRDWSQKADRTPEEVCRAHTEAVIEAMLADAGIQGLEAGDGKKAYMKFEAAIMVIRKHLVGIKEQNHFLMKSRPPA